MARKGRPPLGDRAMTPRERQWRHRYKMKSSKIVNVSRQDLINLLDIAILKLQVNVLDAWTATDVQKAYKFADEACDTQLLRDLIRNSNEIKLTD